MGENISTIPINDIFEPKSGCPFCRAYSVLEQRSIEYILGGAMMQPEIRIKTNETGFCKTHYKKMLSTGNRLQNALLLQSHLKYISENIFSDGKNGKKIEKQALLSLRRLNGSCYVCDRINLSMIHFMKTTIDMWQKDENFKRLFSQQEYFCMPHYEMLIETVYKSGITKKEKASFCNEIARLCNKYIETKRKDIDDFCAMFDYRNSGNVMASPDCVEKCTELLCGDKD
ncbi:MAG: DUF6062 family protein [Clostridiales bacterium]|nr:DUF6062 family protein [Clostridiales bacterium]